MDDMQINLCADTETVIRYYSQMVYRLAFARSGNKYDADEVYQEGFLAICKQKAKFQG